MAKEEKKEKKEKKKGLTQEEYQQNRIKVRDAEDKKNANS